MVLTDEFNFILESNCLFIFLDEFIFLVFNIFIRKNIAKYIYAEVVLYRKVLLLLNRKSERKEKKNK